MAHRFPTRNNGPLGSSCQATAGSPGRGELSITWVWPVPSPPLGLAVFVLKMRTSSCDPRAGPPGWRPLCHASSISRAAPPDPTPETEASEHFLTTLSVVSPVALLFSFPYYSISSMKLRTLFCLCQHFIYFLYGKYPMSFI